RPLICDECRSRRASCAGLTVAGRRSGRRLAGGLITMDATRVTTRVTSVSWIPSEAVTGPAKTAFEVGFTHYDDPPPDVISDLAALHRQGAFRFANVLSVWADVEEGRIARAGYADDAGLLMGTTTVWI